MKTITKKQSEEFVEKLYKELTKIGAKKVDDAISVFRTFELDTVVGKLEINVDTDNLHCYTMFARFKDVNKAKEKFSCNPHSGKYNTHIGNTEGLTPDKAVEICMIAIEVTQPKELA